MTLTVATGGRAEEATPGEAEEMCFSAGPSVVICVAAAMVEGGLEVCLMDLSTARESCLFAPSLPAPPEDPPNEPLDREPTLQFTL